jgi:hypothetical protein
MHPAFEVVTSAAPQRSSPEEFHHVCSRYVCCEHCVRVLENSPLEFRALLLRALRHHDQECDVHDSRRPKLLDAGIEESDTALRAAPLVHLSLEKCVFVRNGAPEKFVGYFVQQRPFCCKESMVRACSSDTAITIGFTFCTVKRLLVTEQDR